MENVKFEMEKNEGELKLLPKVKKRYPYFFDTSILFDDNITLYFINTGRGTGKTTNGLDGVSWVARHLDKEFVYLDTNDDLVNTLDRRTKIFNNNKDDNEIFYRIQHFYDREYETASGRRANGFDKVKNNDDDIPPKVLGHYMMLQNFTGYKSGDWSNVDYWIIDEASDKINNYNGNFGNDFRNLVSTVLRRRPFSKFFFFGNLENAGNDFYQSIGFNDEFIENNLHKKIIQTIPLIKEIPTAKGKIKAEYDLKVMFYTFTMDDITLPPESEGEYILADAIGQFLGGDNDSVNIDWEVTKYGVEKQVIDDDEPVILFDNKLGKQLYMTLDGYFSISKIGTITKNSHVDNQDQDTETKKVIQKYREKASYFQYETMQTKFTVAKMFNVL